MKQSKNFYWCIIKKERDMAVPLCVEEAYLHPCAS